MKSVTDIITEKTDWNMEELERFAKANFVNTRRQENLLLLNYEDDIDHDQWNDFNSQCRGLIIDLESKSCIAHPYDKFFNIDTHPSTKIDALPLSSGYEISRKYDGSMITCFSSDNRVRFATRGSFENAQTQLAEELYLAKYPTLSQVPYSRFTLIFEVMSPSFDMIIPTSENDLILIGVRDREQQTMLCYSDVIKFAQDYQLQALSLTNHRFEDLLAQARDGNETQYDEGWVVRFENGQYVKVKTWQYLAFRYIQHLGLTKKQLIRNYCESKAEKWQSFLENVPTLAAREAVIAFSKLIDQHFIQVEQNIKNVYQGFAHIDHPKDFAEAIRTNAPEHMASLLFSYRSGKPLLIGIRLKYGSFIDSDNFAEPVHPSMIKEWAFSKKD